MVPRIFALIVFWMLFAGVVQSKAQDPKIRIFIFVIPESRTEYHSIVCSSLKEPLLKEMIYEIITEEEIEKTLKKLNIRGFSVLEWTKNDFDLVKRVGREVRADYGMVVYLQRSSPIRTLDLRDSLIFALINIDTGAQFEVYKTVRTLDFGNFLITACKELISKARTDIYAKGIEKSPLSAKVSRDLSSYQIKSSDRLVVYDLNASESLKMLALIFSSTLREEIFKLGSFTLVNREDMVKALEEIALQQTGLINEEQAIQTGKMIAANQIILGSIGIIGNTFVIQVKRFDVETMKALSFSSLECPVGKEADMLKRIPELARRITGINGF